MSDAVKKRITKRLADDVFDLIHDITDIGKGTVYDYLKIPLGEGDISTPPTGSNPKNIPGSNTESEQKKDEKKTPSDKTTEEHKH